jgi:hypothetical protein
MGTVTYLLTIETCVAEITARTATTTGEAHARHGHSRRGSNERPTWSAFRFEHLTHLNNAIDGTSVSANVRRSNA